MGLTAEPRPSLHREELWGQGWVQATKWEPGSQEAACGGPPPPQDTKNSSNHHAERSQADKKGRSPYPAPPIDGVTAQLSRMRGPREAALAPHPLTRPPQLGAGTQAGWEVGRGCTQGLRLQTQLRGQSRTLESETLSH